MTTKELVLAAAVSLPSPTETGDIWHRRGVTAVTGHRAYTEEEADITHLMSLGYKLLVGIKAVRAFRYAAGLGSSAVYKKGWGCIQYSGDIPERLIDRITKAKEQFRELTIHSNMPLPTETFDGADPVVIGWPHYTDMTIHPDGSITMFNMFKAVGAVVAMWDMDKEVADIL